jgi:hypothetical protein
MFFQLHPRVAQRDAARARSSSNRYGAIIAS